jgi:hypothetical protein
MANGGLGIAIGEAGIGSVLTKYPLRVPLNQRSYAWEDGHVKLDRLLGAIRSAGAHWLERL